MATTTRGALPYPVSTNPPNGPAQIQALADRLAAIGVFYSDGTLASRPAAATALSGWVYYATDNGKVYYCTGSAWVTLNPSIAAGAIGTTELASLAVTAAKIANAAVGVDKQNNNAGYASGTLTFTADSASRIYTPSIADKYDPAVDGPFFEAVGSGNLYISFPVTGTYRVESNVDNLSANGVNYKHGWILGDATEVVAVTGQMFATGDGLRGLPSLSRIMNRTLGETIKFFGYCDIGGTARVTFSVERIR